ncbi:MAG: hypothetical protein ACRESE_06545 [Gammaproteobacteria bacterium]
MNDACESNRGSPRDLTRDMSVWLFWCLPIALLIAGGIWHFGASWLWVAAFAMMGIGCAAEYPLGRYAGSHIVNRRD